MTRQEQILKAAEFSQSKFLRNAGYDDDKPRNNSEEWCVRGAESMQKQMLPIITALAKENSRLREALEFTHKKLGSCAFSNQDKWGDVMESVYSRSKYVIGEPSEVDAILKGGG